jgi:methylase of polypeptide subunit release factors
VSPSRKDLFPAWYAELESRHLKDMKFAEIRRALEALSTVYVQRREAITRGAALDSAGKRAAFALFYGPLHFLAVAHVLEQLRPRKPYPKRIIDIGCGSGAAGAAWGVAAGCKPSIRGYDLNPWAVREAGWTLRQFGLDHTVSRRDVSRAPMPGRKDGLLAAWVVNELRDATRDELLLRLMEAAGNGSEILIVEPVAKGVAPWWDDWADRFQVAGGRSEQWDFRPDMPDSLRLLDRAAKLDHRRYKLRTLSVNIGE